ncbi:MAG: hypothetical protein PVJ52_00020 [Candidatus Woesebacteria bacterium]|jgi:hypothetical protein
MDILRPSLKERRIVIIVLSVLFITAVASFIFFGAQESQQEEKIGEVPITTPSQKDFYEEGIPNAPPALKDEEDTPNPQALEEKQKVTGELPIYIDNFRTSTDKLTTINIYSSQYMPEHTLMLEIYGVNYYNSAATDTNPDYIAFKESLEEAKNQLESRGVEFDSLRFIFGTKGYIHTTAKAWAKELGYIDY